MVPDVATGDPTKLLCLNCARRIVAPRIVSKYAGLGAYLKFKGAFTDLVKLGFARIDGIIGDNLPLEAYRDEKWWENTPSRMHARGWLEAGWEVQEVNLKEGYVVFKRVRIVQTPRSRKKAVGMQINKPFTPVPVHFQKQKIPSKTKVSKLYARIKNIERQRTSMPTYHGSFKPKSKHEKTLQTRLKTDEISAPRAHMLQGRRMDGATCSGTK